MFDCIANSTTSGRDEGLGLPASAVGLVGRSDRRGLMKFRNAPYALMGAAGSLMAMTAMAFGQD
ncbi:MAG: hypothetical protein J0H54_07660, partial [Rhizobiales bacterium]|nr:hypothetical protein [Hyphomicrobiales bacterium]